MNNPHDYEYNCYMCENWYESEHELSLIGYDGHGDAVCVCSAACESEYEAAVQDARDCYETDQALAQQFRSGRMTL